jgi:hypothetical protein
MRFHPVGKTIGNANSEGPDLIMPSTEPDEPPRPKKRAVGGGQLDLF